MGLEGKAYISGGDSYCKLIVGMLKKGEEGTLEHFKIRVEEEVF